MRRQTQQEVDQWMERARQHGLVDDQGNWEVGRSIIEGIVEGSEGREVNIRIITPILATLRTENLELKSLPIRFDRTSDGQIIIPGRWWASSFEEMSLDDEHSPGVRQEAALASRKFNFEDILLPADTDTIEVLVPDDDGNPVPYEALKPSTCVKLSLIL
ncbi:hypothetical protein MYX64_08490 [Nitrospinae bacterium AH_259_B05_G02_I21]|nr:hypothetical protein [Nitrospinae bacterium AH_259_B05_G02_I21]MDA2932425.1 hypothetical protein [Nitrospinae bacterium AH-259-F20]